MKALIQYSLPALLVGAALGYVGADVRHNGKASRPSQLPGSRQESGWFSAGEQTDTQCPEINYARIAQECARAQGSQGGAHRSSGAAYRSAGMDPNQASANEARAELALTEIINQAVEQEQWSKQAGTHARRLLQQARPDEAESFENVLIETIRAGKMSIQSGAWVPERVLGAVQRPQP